MNESRKKTNDSVTSKIELFELILIILQYIYGEGIILILNYNLSFLT